MTVPKKANADPTKAFFVHTITKDITLEDCVLDLLDNCVDGAWKLEGGKPVGLANAKDLVKYRIDIEIDADHFRIIDNCGGITLDDAAEYAFTFGRRQDEVPERYSIGVYGIGMKRAIFKMGTDITIRSTYRAKRKLESFRVPIDVNKWLDDDKTAHWDFDIESSTDLDEPGVEITVRQLNESTSVSFGNPTFIQTLRRVIARDYALHLHRGLTVALNEEPIFGWQIEMRQGGGFQPMRIAYKDENEEVDIEILAGMTAPPPDDSEPDADGDGDGELRSGWYVVCNGRIVLAADQSSTSGWGTDNWPKWHPQYAGFIGFVVFASKEAKLLPLTTTKRNVDATSAIYRRALPRMREVSRRWIDYTNQRKQTIEEARKLEQVAKPMPIYEVAVRQYVALPQLAPKPKVKPANVAYSVPLEKLRNLARELGNVNMSYREVGLKSFDYAYAEHVGAE